MPESTRSLRILHLGYEDPRRPWAGGGSVRTHEINRRLARDHEVTVLCAGYPTSSARIEDGVKYQHIGSRVPRVRDSHYLSLLAYFAALPYAVAKHKADLIVEDFGAPFGSIGVPAWTKTPTVGVVQWLFASQTSRHYHLPFGVVESAGLKSHRHMIAVSEELGRQLKTRNPKARVTVVPNGIDQDLLDHRAKKEARRNFLFVGRLETRQKGIDLLIQAFAMIAAAVNEDLLIAGDGADRDALKRLAENLGVADRVIFLGRISGRAKADALDSARVLVVPSRWETFGLVAAEGLARATPVIAFDIPCLREVVPLDAGVIVPVEGGHFSARLLANAMLELMQRPDVAADLGSRGPSGVAKYRWHTAAQDQEAVYLDAVAASPEPAPWKLLRASRRS